MDYLFDVMRHIQAMRTWARSAGVAAIVDIVTLELTLGLPDGRRMRLNPRFMIKTPGGPAYTTTFTNRCRFVGWPPYEMKQWPVGSSKSVFKDYCVQHGLKTPAVWRRESDNQGAYLIKPSAGSWGQGIRGPYAHHEIPDRLADADSDCVIEQFITGRPAKIWYWNATPAAMHVAMPPTVLGDGRRTIRSILAQPRGSFDRRFEEVGNADYMNWQGAEADSVLPPGQQVTLDFLLATPFDRAERTEPRHLTAHSEVIQQQLAATGVVMAQAIPASKRANTYYTVDVVIDDEEQFWLLEMNCHPVLHPAIYQHMMPDLVMA